MKNFLVFAVLILLASCLTERKATRQLDRINSLQPSSLASKCASTFPIKESTSTSTVYLPGETVFTPGHIVKVDCDTVRVTNTKDRIVWLKCPPVPFRVDTFRKDSIVTMENTAKVTLLQTKLETKTTEAQVLKYRVTVLQRWLAGLAILILAFIAIKYFFKLF